MDLVEQYVASYNKLVKAIDGKKGQEAEQAPFDDCDRAWNAMTDAQRREACVLTGYETEVEEIMENWNAQQKEQD